MNEPHIAAKVPAVLTLEPGTYSWCSCGYSQNQPFCDGAHMGKGFCPTTLTIEETRKVALCQCKYTQNPPYCDGAHRNL